MRFNTITYVQPKRAVLFASVLFVIQLILRTEVEFAALTLLYVFLSTAAFNLGGGLVYPSGAFAFFTATLTALVGIVYKVFLGEPGQGNLTSPNTTMLVYCAGMAAIAFAAFLSHSLMPKRPLLVGIVSTENMMRSAIGCFIIGLAFQFLAFLLPFQVYTALAQVNEFYPVAMVLGIFYEIKRSGGRRSGNWVVWGAGLMIFASGLIGFSKLGIFTPLLVWSLSCLLWGYRFRAVQVIAVVLFTIFSFYYLVPYSQYARDFRPQDDTVTQDTEIAFKYLSDLPATRRAYEAQSLSERNGFDTGWHFFDQPEGFFDRLEMLAPDDALVNFTDQRGAIGLAPTYLNYLNLLPHVLYPDKPTLGFGNLYAREMGFISQNDTTTGISFSPAADTYHQRKWFGVLVVLPIILFLLFFVMDSLTGDLRLSPWGILPIAAFAHIAPEGGVTYPIHFTVYGALGLLLVALVVRYVVPIFGDLLIAKRIAPGEEDRMASPLRARSALVPVPKLPRD